MSTPPTPPTYWWLTVRIDACRTRDERVAAASGDDAVRMWRELHPNVEVIHVRPVPEFVDTKLEHMSTHNNSHDLLSLDELCAELIDALDGWHQAVLETGSGWVRPDEAYLLDRARAALAELDGPAVPEGREPAAVTVEPSDEELLATLDKATADFPPRHPDAKALNAVEYPLALELRKARSVLARWGRPAPVPAGEVAELAKWLYRLADERTCNRRRGIRPHPSALTRAAALLERQAAPVPVVVSERLPEPSVKVLAHYFNDLGKGRTICAIWVPAKSRCGDYGDDDFTEYDEETDKFYWPEGWYEAIENWDDLGWVKVDEGEVIYWQPLPKWPAHALPLSNGEVE